MEYILLLIIFIIGINAINVPKSSKLTKEQEEYERFMELSGNYDDDDEDIASNKKWRDKVYNH